MSKELRVALVGMGKMGMHHLRAIERQPNARLVAVTDPRMGDNGLGDDLPDSVTKFREVDEMLQRLKPDVVHVATPPETHVEIARKAVEAGAHVYVEKPFSLTAQEAEDLLDIAERRGIKVCPAHQVLFQRSGAAYRKYLPFIKEIVHVESYFSFKAVRRAPDGKGAISPVEQLLDILPHPVYLLLSALEAADNDTEHPLLTRFIDVDPSGEVRAVFKKGGTYGLLIVSLRARPIESYLKVSGANGQIVADFVLAGVQRHLGPGASAISLVYKPFAEAVQVVGGTLGTIIRMIFSRQKSYAGLSELIQQFYGCIVSDKPLPVSRDSLVGTVRICEAIGERLRDKEREKESADMERLSEIESRLDPIDPAKGWILVTGGTGFLGRVVTQELRVRGWPVRVVARRLPKATERVPGVAYVEGDVSEPLPTGVFQDVTCIAHLAAETAGGQAAHQRNTIDSTQYLVAAAIRHKIPRFINISSIAVLKPSTLAGNALDEQSPVDADNLTRGPYVWGKARAEEIVRAAAVSGAIEAKTIRLGPLVDFQDFVPPGRLGREVGPLFVVMGNPWDKLNLCDVHTAARVIRYYVEKFNVAPVSLNLVEAPPRTRLELVRINKGIRPDLTHVWLFTPFLRAISFAAFGISKLLRPHAKPLDLHAAFSTERYDTRVASQVIQQAQTDAP